MRVVSWLCVRLHIRARTLELLKPNGGGVQVTAHPGSHGMGHEA
jgi:hypothetical protein